MFALHLETFAFIETYERRWLIKVHSVTAARLIAPPVLPFTTHHVPTTSTVITDERLH